MGDRRTIEDEVDPVPPFASNAPGARTHRLRVATADGPVFSADGSIAVIRTDPGLADFLRNVAELELLRGTPEGPWVEDLRRAAALLAAPAPADPEEGRDE